MHPEKKTKLIQLLLFLLTLACTTLAGAEWIYGRSILENHDNWISLEKLESGFLFSLPFLGILTIHEFGHYFTAKRNKVDASLPYYIPFWFGILPTIGTLGAFIRIKTRNITNKQYFDIGLAGPLAGFIAALILLAYGFTHLPPLEYIFSIHPEYVKYGTDFPKYVYTDLSNTFYLGDNLLFHFFEHFVADPSRIPPKYEVIHYPYLMAGYLALFFTSLNLLPIGQLDGGHILYGLVGHRWHFFISKSIFLIFIFFAGLGIVHPYMEFSSAIVRFGLYLFFLFTILRSSFASSTNRWMIAVGLASLQFFLAYLFPHIEGYPNWLLFAFVIGRFLGVEHPKAEDVPIDTGRKILGWLSLVIFILCFSPQPFVTN